MSTHPDTSPSDALLSAVHFIREHVSSRIPRVGIVLGSGLGGLVDAVEVDGAISYRDIPGFLGSTVDGHSGRLVLGTLAGLPVAVMQGRVHMYEGHSADSVVFPVRVLVRLGATGLIVTNAAGGVNPSYEAQEVMVIRDHLNLTGRNPLVGPNDLALGPRFSDMSEAYDAKLRQLAHEVAAGLGMRLREGVYAGVLGPSYETPAEVRMLGLLGADAVGMSTVTEVIAARHMGARVLGLSCISNKGAGLASEPLSHEEVKEAAQAMQDKFVALICGLAQAWPPSA